MYNSLFHFEQKNWEVNVCLNVHLLFVSYEVPEPQLALSANLLHPLLNSITKTRDKKLKGSTSQY